MIPRLEEIERLRGLLRRHRVVGIIGARQVCKTTLSRMLASEWRGESSFFDLESAEDQARFADPMLALKSLRGLVIIDEIQRLPNLFTVLRVLTARSAFSGLPMPAPKLDLLVVSGRLRLGFKFKRTSSPHVTPSIRQSIKDLGLQRLDVIHAGNQTFPISEHIRAVALSRLLDDIKPLSGS